MIALILRALRAAPWTAAFALALCGLASCDPGDPDPDPDPGPPAPPCAFPPVEFRLCEAAETCNEPLWLPFFSDPAWHPGGRYIAAAHADSLDADGDCRYDAYFHGIWLVEAETGARKPLLEGPFGEPDWSPDGHRLAVTDVAQAQIFVVEVADLDAAQVVAGSLRQVTTEGTNFAPAWGPNETLLYNAYIGDELGSIWIIKIDVMDKRRLTMGYYPDWSPSGSHFIYFDLYGDIYLASVSNPDDRERLTFFNTPGNYSLYGYEVHLNADADQVAFEGRIESLNQQGVFVMNADGTEIHHLPYGDLAEIDWDPSGSRLIAVRKANVPDRWSGQLYTIEADGSDLTPLTDYFPAWGRCPLGC